jgi:hypothetical protein
MLCIMIDPSYPLRLIPRWIMLQLDNVDRIA